MSYSRPLIIDQIDNLLTTNNKTPYSIISMDGNIGSGKSTLLQQLKDVYKENTNIVFIDEPVTEWESIQDQNGISILQKFYMDQEKYAFCFQIMAYITRLVNMKKTIQQYGNNKIYITERSLYTDKMVFAKMLYDSQQMEEVEYRVYLRLFDEFIPEYPLSAVIYINTCPEKCKERIQMRSRKGEEQIPLEYLTKCDKYHNDMINQLECMILLYDGNIDNPDYLHLKP
jgi:deoxyadenosine/deoxycytidine kinase